MHTCKRCVITQDDSNVLWFARVCGMDLKTVHVKVQKVWSSYCSGNPDKISPPHLPGNPGRRYSRIS